MRAPVRAGHLAVGVKSRAVVAQATQLDPVMVDVAPLDREEVEGQVGSGRDLHEPDPLHAVGVHIVRGHRHPGQVRHTQTLVRAPVVHGRDPFAHDAVQLVDEEERLGLHVDAPAVHIWAFVARKRCQQALPYGPEETFHGGLIARLQLHPVVKVRAVS